VSAKLRVVGARKTFRQKNGGEVEAIAGLEFSVAEGEYVAIVGPTGAGKTVLFDCIMALKTLSAGTIEIDGTEAAAWCRARHGRIARIFQEDRLLPWRTAAENVVLGLEIKGVGKAERLDAARRWLDAVGLARFADAFPGELSGGMKQRVNIARAFALEPEIILMDEAFSALDEITATKLRADFLALAQRQQMTFLIITHSLEEAIILGNRILVFASPARLLRDIAVPAEVKRDPHRWYDLRREIAEWLGGGVPETPP
jgi:NitT/TauT family transport system ATP-binding protein